MFHFQVTLNVTTNPVTSFRRQNGRYVWCRLFRKTSRRRHGKKLTLTTNTGHFTLFVDVRTNFVVTAFMGLLSIPTGGTSCRDTHTHTHGKKNSLMVQKAENKPRQTTHVVKATCIRLDSAQISVIPLPQTILSGKT